MRYDMTFWWAQHEFHSFADVSVGPCHANGVDWTDIAVYTWQQMDECSHEDHFRFFDHVGPNEFPFSGVNSDCFLGVVALVMVDFWCLKQVLVFAHSWRRVQLYLEALWFYLRILPEQIFESPWPIFPLLERIGRKMRDTFPSSLVPNTCDLLDTPTDVELRERLRRSDLLAAKKIMERPKVCPFAHAVAIVMTRDAFPNWGKLFLDAMLSWDAIGADTQGKKRHFFFDLVTTSWPLLQMLIFMPPTMPPFPALYNFHPAVVDFETADLNAIMRGFTIWRRKRQKNRQNERNNTKIAMNSIKERNNKKGAE
eukprot:GEMP01020543.1.p1 GENE.GEMP01020543.1~~GEMP01020543.1.p1  ORF type:complete len:311 (+),score=38.91 GEMP01020543.1:233-1165(+)